jgi:hypothetical protein
MVLARSVGGAAAHPCSEPGGGESTGCITTACSGPGPRISSRRTGHVQRCAVPAADAERYADLKRDVR